jgi:hypothetical protein
VAATGVILLGAVMLGLWLHKGGEPAATVPAASATSVPAASASVPAASVPPASVPPASAATTDGPQAGTPASSQADTPASSTTATSTTDTATQPSTTQPSTTLPALLPTTAAPGDSSATATATGNSPTPTSAQPPSGSGDAGVALAPGAAAQASPEVVSRIVQVLDTYVSGINRREFASAYRAYSAKEKAKNPYPAWSLAESTSQLTGVTVVGLHGSVTGPGSGPVTADVTFTSRQSESAAPVPAETCSRWSLTYTLVPDRSGTGYLIDDAQPINGSAHAPC